MTGVRGVDTSIGTGIFPNQTYLQAACSPKGLFCGSHPSFTSYSNGLTGEEELEEQEEEGSRREGLD